MNENMQPPEGAILLSDAPQRFGDRKLYAKWLEKGKPRQGVLHPGIGASAAERETARAYRAAQRANSAAAKRLADDLARQFVEGLLVAWGRDGAPTGPWTLIPPDAWKYLTPNWRNDTAFSKNGTEFFSVQVISSLPSAKRRANGEMDSNGIPPGGLSLSEAYEFFVEEGKVDDEFRTSSGVDETLFHDHSTLRHAICSLRYEDAGWAEILLQQRPGYRMYGFRRPVSGGMMGIWVTPVNPDLWKNPEEESRSAARSDGKFDDDDIKLGTKVPDLVVAIHALRRRLEAQLIGRLADGAIQLRGMLETSSPPLSFIPEDIPSTLLRRHEVLVSFDESMLLWVTREFDIRRIGGGELIPEKWLAKCHSDVRAYRSFDLMAEDVDQSSADLADIKQLQFSEKKVTEAYRQRVKNWPLDSRSPTRREDEEWGRDEFGAPREIIRELRRIHAPEDWKITGPKTTSKRANR